jgi:demethylmenaquinone methyltransferase/2-methoxy-6-polyprenyl-1,4-benzoquinol methylase
MTGMGEIIPDVGRLIGAEGSVTGIDFSDQMCRAARQYTVSRVPCPVRIIEADVLSVDLPPGSADVVVSSFGLKTFSSAQLPALARLVRDALGPGGRLSLVEISVPRSRWLRALYLFYLCRLIPVIGALFLGNPENYRMLGIYTKAFGDCSEACRAFSESGLEVEMVSYFFGCATGVVGRRP